MRSECHRRIVGIAALACTLCSAGPLLGQSVSIARTSGDGEMYVPAEALARWSGPPIFVDERGNVLVMATGDKPYQRAMLRSAARWVAEHREELETMLRERWPAEFRRKHGSSAFASLTRFLNDRLAEWLDTPGEDGVAPAVRIAADALRAVERGGVAAARFGDPGNCPPVAQCETKAICPWLPGSPWCDCIDVCWDCCAFYASRKGGDAAGGGRTW